MDLKALLAPDAAPLGQRRADVLALLRAAGSPVGVREVAGQTGLHPNTARFHLDALVDAGLATRAPRARAVPGRPSMAYQAVEGGGAIERLAATLEEIGFAPEAAADGTRYQLRLRQCPFREVAEGHQDVVCQLHLGLMQGALDQMRAPVTADRLQPFAEPSLCIAYLATRQNPGQPREPASP